MTRIEHLGASGLSVEDVGTLLDAVAAVVEPVRLAYLWRPILPDADDDMVLEAAVNGGADAIVTFNLRDFELPAKQFGIAIMPPGDAVNNWRRSDEKEQFCVAAAAVATRRGA
jgi:predicted nucleic acid-binding protein